MRLDPQRYVPAFEENVLCFVPAADIARCTAVSKAWRTALTCDRLWRDLCVRDHAVLSDDACLWKLATENWCCYHAAISRASRPGKHGKQALGFIDIQPRAMVVTASASVSLESDEEEDNVYEALNRASHVLLQVEPLRSFAAHLLCQVDCPGEVNSLRFSLDPHLLAACRMLMLHHENEGHKVVIVAPDPALQMLAKLFARPFVSLQLMSDQEVRRVRASFRGTPGYCSLLTGNFLDVDSTMEEVIRDGNVVIDLTQDPQELLAVTGSVGTAFADKGSGTYLYQFSCETRFDNAGSSKGWYRFWESQALEPTTVLMSELDAYHASWQLSHSLFGHRNIEDFIVERCWPIHRQIQVKNARFQTSSSRVNASARAYVSRSARSNANQIASGGGEDGDGQDTGGVAATGVRVLSASPSRWDESRAARRGRDARAPEGGLHQHVSVREARKSQSSAGSAGDGTAANAGRGARSATRGVVRVRVDSRADGGGAGAERASAAAVRYSSVREAMSSARQDQRVTRSYVQGAVPIPIPTAGGGSSTMTMVPLHMLVATATASAVSAVGMEDSAAARRTTATAALAAMGVSASAVPTPTATTTAATTAAASGSARGAVMQLQSGARAAGTRRSREPFRKALADGGASRFSGRGIL
jgi:hypothetical protein